MANYYHQFIQDFVSIARLLYDMVKKDQKWEWIEKQEEAFRKLKEKFMQELVLAVLDLDKKNGDGSRCIGLCYKRCIIYRVQRWEIETSCFSLKVLK